MRPTLPTLTGPRIHELLRLVLLVLCAAVALTTGHPSAELTWLAPLAALGLLASRPRGGRLGAILETSLESFVVGVAVAGERESHRTTSCAQLRYRVDQQVCALDVPELADIAQVGGVFGPNDRIELAATRIGL